MTQMLTESQIQKAVFADLSARGMPGIVFWHTPNDPSSRSKVGYRAGIPDVTILHRGKFYAIELKKAKGGVVSVDQLKTISDINAADGFAFVAEGLAEALAGLEAWGLVRRAVA